MGSVVWSADTLIISYLQPSIFNFNNEKYREAAIILDGLNNFFVGFGVGITDLKTPVSHSTNMRNELNKVTYSREWFEMNFPMISKSMGIYLRETLDTIKIERGNF